MEYQILAINPGSTSTKLAIFQGEAELAAETLRHSAAELAGFARVADQSGLRRAAITAFLAAAGVPRFDAVIGRGGLLRPLDSGVYAVDPTMLDDLRNARHGEHASNLGAILAAELAAVQGCPAYIADPVVVDELDDIARLTGLPQIRRRSIFHALNQKSAAREAVARRGWRYEERKLIVAHLGGGCSVGAHCRGRVVDVNNALDGEGPFTPERAGSLPAGQLLDLVFSGRHSEAELRRMLTGQGGMVAHLGTNDLLETESRAAAGDEAAGLFLRAMACRIAQEIARHGATLEGTVDLIVITGGMAQEPRLVDLVTRRVRFLAPVEVVPGEREMLSLARAAASALAGQTVVRSYG
jgi:butyrate kinase